MDLSLLTIDWKALITSIMVRILTNVLRAYSESPFTTELPKYKGKKVDDLTVFPLYVFCG